VAGVAYGVAGPFVLEDYGQAFAAVEAVGKVEFASVVLTLAAAFSDFPSAVDWKAGARLRTIRMIPTTSDHSAYRFLVSFH